MSSQATRPFQILGLQQVAIGGTNRQALTQLWTDCLGVPPIGHFRSESENVDEAILQMGRGLGAVELDLMQPIDPARKPRVDSPALNHIGLWVDDLHGATLWLITRGVRFARGGIRKGASGHDVCFIHPRPSAYFPLSGQGVLIELVQAPDEIIAHFEGLPRISLGL